MDWQRTKTGIFWDLYERTEWASFNAVKAWKQHWLSDTNPPFSHLCWLMPESLFVSLLSDRCFQPKCESIKEFLSTIYLLLIYRESFGSICKSSLSLELLHKATSVSILRFKIQGLLKRLYGIFRIPKLSSVENTWGKTLNNSKYPGLFRAEVKFFIWVRKRA